MEISQQPRLKLMNIIIIESLPAPLAGACQYLSTQTPGQPLNQKEFIAAPQHCPILLHV